MKHMAKNTICLWYDGAAEEAARFYAETFPDSSLDAVHRAPGDYPAGEEGSVLTVEFTVLGVACLGLNGGPAFQHSEAFSFQVATEDQEETDRYWNAIVGNGGQESQCGWAYPKPPTLFMRRRLFSFQKTESSRLDPHLIALEAHLPGAQRDGFVLQALAVFQAEVLLVDRRGDHRLALDVADDAAGDDVGAGEGVVVVDGVELLRMAGQVENGDLCGASRGFHPGGDAGVGHQVGAGAEGLPGLGHGVGGGSGGHEKNSWFGRQRAPDGANRPAEPASHRIPPPRWEKRLVGGRFSARMPD